MKTLRRWPFGLGDAFVRDDSELPSDHDALAVRFGWAVTAE